VNVFAALQLHSSLQIIIAINAFQQIVNIFYLNVSKDLQPQKYIPNDSDDV